MKTRADNLIGLWNKTSSEVTEGFYNAINEFFGEIQDRYPADYKAIWAYIEKTAMLNSKYLPKIAELDGYKKQAVSAIVVSKKAVVVENKVSCPYCINSGYVRYSRLENGKVIPFREAGRLRRLEGKRFDTFAATCKCEKGVSKENKWYRRFADLFPEDIDPKMFGFYLTEEEKRECEEWKEKTKNYTPAQKMASLRSEL